MSKAMTKLANEKEDRLLKKLTHLLQFFSLSWKFLLLLQFSSEAFLNQPQKNITIITLRLSSVREVGLISVGD